MSNSKNLEPFILILSISKVFYFSMIRFENASLKRNKNLWLIFTLALLLYFCNSKHCIFMIAYKKKFSSVD